MPNDRVPDAPAALPRRGLSRLWPGRAAARDAAAAPPPDSLFSALTAGDSQLGEDDGRATGKVGSAAGKFAPESAPAADAASPASRLDHRRRVDESSGESATNEDATGQRLYRLFLAARAALGLALVAAFVVSAWFNVRAPLPLMLLAMAYAAQALLMWILPTLGSPAQARLARSAELTRGAWLMTVGTDLVVFSLMHWMQGSVGLRFDALLLLPVLMGGVLASQRVALAGTSFVVLVLLTAAWHSVMLGGESAALWVQTGLTGMGFFAVTLLAREMSSRLALGESAARSGLELARQQAQLNRLVIEQMSEGVLVVDHRQRVRAANPAARRLLSERDLSRAAPFDLAAEGAWQELAAATRKAFEQKAWPLGEHNVTLRFGDGTTRSLRVRGRFTRRRQSAVDPGAEPPVTEAYGVLFLEDLRSVHERHRQEKLAAMGRVSAGIAHEIRNPLAAIAQANALLSEEVQGREHQLLTRMVSENVERLKLIVDDVMAVAPKQDVERPTIDAVDVVGDILSDWARAAALPIGPDTRLRVVINESRLPVTFDPEHLRRVLVNLLDNARRYATQTPGAITLHLHRAGQDNTVLSLASDGEPIPPDVEPYLFEPFFSTRSRGTGLGLYICRELCERYGATIDYWQHPDGSRHRNEFRVVFRTTEPANEFIGSRLLT